LFRLALLNSMHRNIPRRTLLLQAKRIAACRPI
jgi:hypothetical protein